MNWIMKRCVGVLSGLRVLVAARPQALVQRISANTQPARQQRDIATACREQLRQGVRPKPSSGMARLLRSFGHSWQRHYLSLGSLTGVKIEEKIFGQMFSADWLVLGQRQRHLYHAVELAQVAGPRMLLKQP